MTRDVDRLPVDTFQIIQIPSGSARRLELVIDHLPDGQRLSFYTLIARGAQPGKTLLTIGGVHGDEYEGPTAIQNVFNEIVPSAMRGTFVGIPVMNGPAFAAAQREGHWDHLNLARVFPGSGSGSPTMRIAHVFRKHLLPQADLLLDIHSGGNAYAIKHLAGYQLRDGEIGRVQREAAIAFGADLIWGTGGLPGRTLSAAGELGIPAIYVEMPGEGRCRPEDLARASEGLRNVLAYLGIVEGTFPAYPPRYVVEMSAPGSGHLQVDHPSPTSGIFVSRVDLWERVKAGQVLGQVRHPNGTVLAEVASARDGRVLFLRTLPRVFTGDTLAFILPVPEEDAEMR